jgi:hypothetical protein
VPFASVPAMLAGTEATPRFVAVAGSFGGVFWRCFCGERAVLLENSDVHVMMNMAQRRHLDA